MVPPERPICATAPPMCCGRPATKHIDPDGWYRRWRPDRRATRVLSPMSTCKACAQAFGLSDRTHSLQCLDPPKPSRALSAKVARLHSQASWYRLERPICVIDRTTPVELHSDIVARSRGPYSLNPPKQLIACCIAGASQQCSCPSFRPDGWYRRCCPNRRQPDPRPVTTAAHIRCMVSQTSSPERVPACTRVQILAFSPIMVSPERRICVTTATLRNLPTLRGGGPVRPPPMYSAVLSMTRACPSSSEEVAVVVREKACLSPPQWDAQPSNAQDQGTTRCNQTSSTELWTQQSGSLHAHRSFERSDKIELQVCVPPTTTSISKVKPCDADLHTCASTPMRCGQPTTNLRLGLPLHAASKDLADDTHVPRECLHSGGQYPQCRPHQADPALLSSLGIWPPARPSYRSRRTTNAWQPRHK